MGLIELCRGGVEAEMDPQGLLTVAAEPFNELCGVAVENKSVFFHESWNRKHLHSAKRIIIPATVLLIGRGFEPREGW